MSTFDRLVHNRRVDNGSDVVFLAAIGIVLAALIQVALWWLTSNS